MESILKVKHLRVELEGEIILEDISFEVRQRETLVILGPNGAGKTVLLKALLGLLPHQGEVSWREGVTIAYVPQRVPLIKDVPMTVEEFFELKGVPRKRTEVVLKEVGIENQAFLKKPIGIISSGQFQRVLIAWALVNNPDILLFDEPTAGIDIGGEETVYSLLQRAKRERGLTILLVTHDLTAVYSQATNVLCMNKKMFCYGPPRDSLTPKHLQEMFGEKIKYFLHTHE
jgi:zinc transport system ATP-binding protein